MSARATSRRWRVLSTIAAGALAVKSASVEIEGITAELDVAGVIDVAAERRRMEKDLAAARAEAALAVR